MIGAGTWGTTLALLLARQGPVTLVARDLEHASVLAEKRENRRYLPGVTLPVEIEIVTGGGSVAGATELVILAVPSAAMSQVVESIAGKVPEGTVLLSVAKGLERGSLRRMVPRTGWASVTTGRPGSSLAAWPR